MGYRFLNHTADVAFEAEAASRDEVFQEALAAFTDTLTELDQVQERLSRRFELSASAPDLLLVDWLTELNFAFETEDLLFRRAEVRLTEADGEIRLAAQAWGEEKDHDRHPIKVLIKAVTYHGLELAQTETGWRARVIFDI